MSFVVAAGAMLYSQVQLGWGGDAGLPKTILLYLSLGTLAGYVMSLLTPPEDEGRTERFFLLLRTPLGQEQALRDAGLVEIPGTGTFEDPAMDRQGGPLAPSRQTVSGFLWVAVIALALTALVKALAWWLQYG